MSVSKTVGQGSNPWGHAIIRAYLIFIKKYDIIFIENENRGKFR